MKKIKLHIIILAFFFSLAGGILGYWVATSYSSVYKIPIPVEIREDSSNYKFVNPLIYLATNKSFYSVEFEGLNNDLVTNIRVMTDTGLSSTTSVYYRDLNTGHWTGINEDEIYAPGSMLKVVVLMAISSLAEQRHGLLSKQLFYEPTDETYQHYKPPYNLAPGYHSVDELAQFMIIDSDNSATLALLSDKAIEAEFLRMYNSFRLPPIASSTEDFMSARSYSVVFRALYNSTALSAYNSDQVLQLLSQTTFDQGLVSGVPKGTVIAHKFGERTNLSSKKSVINRELHDCGVIYYPNHPYLICVMTKGQDFDKLASVISKISKLVYTYVDSTYKTK